MATPQAAKPAPFTNSASARPLPNLQAAAEAFGRFLDCLGIALPNAPEPSAERSTAIPNLPEIGGKELAREITGLSYARIYALVSQRAIPHSKRGNRLFFNRAELLAWVAEGSRAERKQGGR